MCPRCRACFTVPADTRSEYYSGLVEAVLGGRDEGAWRLESCFVVSEGTWCLESRFDSPPKVALRSPDAQARGVMHDEVLGK
eukprot:10366892-Alexandrium_andersonii.AAC.1